MSFKRVIQTKLAPAAIGPYSQAIAAHQTLYISGQLGMDPDEGTLVGGLEEQTRQALVNMGSILKAAKADYANVVKTTVLLTDMNNFTIVNNVYKDFFTENPPARACYQVSALPKNGLVEIEAIAHIES